MVLKKYLVFFIFLLVTFSVFTDNQPQISNRDRILVTRLNFYKPERMPTITRPGFCWVNSVVISRSDVWRCMVDNNIFDPCFTTEFPDKVICGSDPSKNQPGFLLQLTRPLPKASKIEKPEKASVWMIELEDGNICKLYSGTMPIIHNGNNVLAVRYGCRNGENNGVNGLLDGSVVLGKIGHAKKITYVTTANEIKVIKIQTVKIKKAWR